MSDLGSFLLRIQPYRSADIPSRTGRAVHAWYLASLQAIMPELSEAVHNGNFLKPFTLNEISPVKYHHELQRLSPRSIYSVRVTTLHKDVTRITQNSLVPTWKKDGIILHQQAFKVIDIQQDLTTYQALVAKHRASYNRQIRLQFISPTAVKQGGDNFLPLPVPSILFGTLANKWEEFSGYPLPEGFRDWAKKSVMVSHFKGETLDINRERANKGILSGFVGDATFTATNGEMPHIGWWHVLGNYAYYAGCGAKTTQGLGQVRPLKRHDEAFFAYGDIVENYGEKWDTPPLENHNGTSES
jgi:CRISPR-associated endoribonuclease Cas6